MTPPIPGDGADAILPPYTPAWRRRIRAVKLADHGRVRRERAKLAAFVKRRLQRELGARDAKGGQHAVGL